MLENHIIMHSYITGCLVRYMHIMTLLNESDECTTH